MAAAPAAPTVQPAPGVAPAPAEVAPAPAAQEEGIPQEVAQIPIMAALLQGQPGAVSINLSQAESHPEIQILAKYQQPLMDAGFATYRALSGDIGVIFNQMFINGEELKAADKAGQLAQIAPPFDAVNTAVAQAGPEGHPALINKERPAGAKSAPQLSPPTFPAGGQPAEAANKLASDRLKNIKPTAPKDGSKAGNLLREITKPVL